MLVQQLASIRQAEINEMVTDLDNAILLTQQGCSEVETKYNEVKNNYDAISGDRDKLNSVIKVTESEILIRAKEIKSLELEVEEASRQLSVEEAEKKLQDIREQLALIETQREEKRHQYSAYLIIRNASSASSPARLNSVARLLPALAQGVTNVATHLFARPIRVNFTINDKQLEIESPDLYLNTMSTGERKSFDIAWACTLQDVLLQSSRNQIGFFIGDELFDGLDVERISAAINLIKALPIPQVFIITHNEHAKAAIELSQGVSILRVNNEDGISRASFVASDKVAETTTPESESKPTSQKPRSNRAKKE